MESTPLTSFQTKTEFRMPRTTKEGQLISSPLRCSDKRPAVAKRHVVMREEISLVDAVN